MDELLKNEIKPDSCLSCGAGLTGRLGKKFCSDQCRAQFHNKIKSKEERWIHEVHRILRKNRSVLKSLNPAGHATVRQEVLVNMGFDARFYSHQYKTNNGHVYYFCYEWGYKMVENEKVLIVQWQKNMKPFTPFLL